MKSLFRLFIVSCILSFVIPVFASQTFIIRQIEIRGTENVLPSTVRSYLPIHEGQEFNTETSNQVLQALYKTGFFNTVDIWQRGNTLIIDVKERPMITLIRIDGNKEIDTDKIQPVMKKVGLVAGQIYDPVKLNLFTQSLEQQYALLGYGATSVTASIKDAGHNRVSIYIKVDEGSVVKVKSIHISGNHAFKERTLVNQFKLTTPGLFTWYTHADRYSSMKLDQDLQNLTQFYNNNGYVRFRIVSHEAVLTPDKKHINIYVRVAEGPVYTISGVDVTGETLGHTAELKRLISYKSGDIFSRKKIIDSEKAISDFFANRAYAFAQVNVVPDVNDANRTVHITYNIVSGNRVYVNRIQFSGNQVTKEEVLRREMRQMEAAPYSLSKVNESKRRLMLTNYFSTVDVNMHPVPDTTDEVNLNVHVKEQASGKASIQGGYSSAYGFLYGASITQPNFFGNGKYVSIGFNNSQVTQSYYISYINPYYTWYNVSRGFTVYYNRSNYSKSFGYTPYIMDSFGGDIIYGFPLSENNSLGLDFGYMRVNLSHIDNTGNLAPSVINFIKPTPGETNSNNVKRSYNVTKTTGSWTYNGLDRVQMPTEGVQNQVSLELGVPILDQNIAYYIVSEKMTAYLPLSNSGFILNFLANVGYGQSYDGTNLFPFFNNFYGGGIGTVPGFESNTLGPKYNAGSNAGAALGGNLITTAGIHFILPNWFSDSVRVALTLDAGNVFQSPVYAGDLAATVPVTPPGGPTPPEAVNLVTQDSPFSFSNFRVSGGVLVTWYAPMFGPIDLSLAFPLNKRPGDQTEPFQFAMGMSF